MNRATRARFLKAPEFKSRERAGFIAAGQPADVDLPIGHSARSRPAWRVIIADASEARIYAADSGVSRLKLLATLRNPSARTPDQEILTGRGGSKFNRAGGNYQSLAPTSKVHQEKNAQFAKAVAVVAGLDVRRDERIALFAGARLLSLIAGALSRPARALLARSIPRDVTHEPVARLRVRLQRELIEGGARR